MEIFNEATITFLVIMCIAFFIVRDAAKHKNYRK